ncbi:GTP-binding protein [Alphaproteobacteria bacterium]|nr:GTP-binding protein [Alphaproteobacteria bacterium]GHS96175.1 GTP-binding protein [Alphaproteobacteria bacterium]
MLSLRNIAIVAHVDHGKTTLIDAILAQSGTFRSNQNVAERVMDSNDLERERGITILAKCTSFQWKETRVNVVDTPGHADFGGEVERILNMVDGAILLIDAAEGPLPQTKFVLMKALRLGLKPIVVINKIDRADERHQEVLNEVFDLFVSLDATDEQLDFPILYASGRNGWAVHDLSEEKKDLTPLFEEILKHVPEAYSEEALAKPLSMLVTTREYDAYLGRVLTGRIATGKMTPNMFVHVCNQQGDVVETGRIAKLLAFRGIERIPTELAEAGDIVAIAGLEKATVSDTLCDPAEVVVIPAEPVDPPKLAITLSANDSPLAGREGRKVTFRMIYDRLMREAEGNIAIAVTMSERKDSLVVAGRGELQLGVLIETMRREGFEMSISRPKVLYKTDEKTGAKLEPFEEIYVDVDDDYSGTVVESLSYRKAEMTDMRPCGKGRTRLTFVGPSRGLVGYNNQFLTETRGTGILNHTFCDYRPSTGAMERRRNGVLISTDTGDAVAYGLFNLEPRGDLFITAGDKVYEGMIVGEHTRPNDLCVNPLKAKQLSNMRASGKDEAVRLRPARLMTLEQALTYIEDDERVEVTPKTIRLRKAYLDPNERKKASRVEE